MKIAAQIISSSVWILYAGYCQAFFTQVNFTLQNIQAADFHWLPYFETSATIYTINTTEIAIQRSVLLLDNGHSLLESHSTFSLLYTRWEVFHSQNYSNNNRFQRTRLKLLRAISARSIPRRLSEESKFKSAQTGPKWSLATASGPSLAQMPTSYFFLSLSRCVYIIATRREHTHSYICMYL